jgi:DegV family protein with EDD domain
MGKICILTDNSAQFPQLGFQGRNDVLSIPLQVEYRGKVFDDSKEIKASFLPPFATDQNHVRLAPPDVGSLVQLFTRLAQSYDEILAIFLSSSLSPLYSQAQLAAQQIIGQVKITLIDSQTTSIALGIMVQTAAQSAAKNMPVVEIEKLIRSMIPHTYMVLCIPGLSYLYYSGIIDRSQALAGELLGILPLFTLEEGTLSAIEKVRNNRALLDFLQEFMLEFEEISHIAFIQSIPALSKEVKILREHSQLNFPKVPFSEHTISLSLASIVGPRTSGIIIVEKIDQKTGLV